MKRVTRKSNLSVALTGALLGLYACSLQDFEYLEAGAAGAAAQGGSGGSSGSSGGSGGSSEGGSSGSSAGTSPSSSGASGEDAGQGGEAGSGGAPPEAGTSAGGKSAGAGAGGGGAGGGGGAPAAGTSGEGGAFAGAGGDAGDANGQAGDPGTSGTGGQPPLVGNLLENPGFEFGLTGWSVDPPSSVTNRHVYTQAPNPANGSSSSLATWHQTQEYSVFVYQTVTGLEPGTYTFKGSLSTQATQEAYLFARNCGGDDITLDIPPVSYEWFEMSIASFAVSASSCEVGLFVHGVADVDWLNADSFSFEKDP